MKLLESINMEYCCNVDAETAVQAIKSLEQPKKVVLSLCKQFTKEQLCEIFLSGSYVHIEIEQCSCLTVKAVKVIIHANPDLRCFLFTLM